MKAESTLKKEKVFRPENLDELDALAAQTAEGITYVAGATDLLVQSERWQAAQILVDLTGVKALYGTLDIRNDGVLIGAALPISRLIRHPVIRERLPILVETCRQIGSVQIQNRASLGGNIANASPAGDTLPVLSVLEAELWIGPRQKGEFEKLPLDQVMLGPGQTSLNGNRYIAQIFIPFPPANSYWYFRKVGQRQALAISKVSLAVLGKMNEEVIEEVRIAPGSVTPQIVRAKQTEKVLLSKPLTDALIEQARQALMQEVAPISDIRSTREYRRRITGELLREALYRWKEGKISASN